MYIIYDKIFIENGRVIIIELKGKKCEGILIFGIGFYVLKKKEMILYLNKQMNKIILLLNIEMVCKIKVLYFNFYQRVIGFG